MSSFETKALVALIRAHHEGDDGKFNEVAKKVELHLAESEDANDRELSCFIRGMTSGVEFFLVTD